MTRNIKQINTTNMTRNIKQINTTNMTTLNR